MCMSGLSGMSAREKEHPAHVTHRDMPWIHGLLTQGICRDYSRKDGGMKVPKNLKDPCALQHPCQPRFSTFSLGSLGALVCIGGISPALQYFQLPSYWNFSFKNTCPLPSSTMSSTSFNHHHLSSNSLSKKQSSFHNL